MPDGDFVNLVWGQPNLLTESTLSNCKGLVVLFHGLEGSIRSHYANDLMATLQSQGWQTLLMHFRGCGDEVNTTTRAYHSGDTEDASYLLNWLDERFSQLPKVAVGFSLGGNMLLKYLGENPQQPILSAAIAISAPIKLAECSSSMDQGFSRRYQNYLLGSMTSNLIHKMQSMDYSKALNITPQQVTGLQSFRDFDEHVTAPLHGFSGADDYYQKCSAVGFLKYISTPTLILHSLDDPFMNEAVVPHNDDLSDSIEFELSDTGGHVGFMHGSPWDPKIWYHQRILDYIKPYTAKK